MKFRFLFSFLALVIIQSLNAQITKPEVTEVWEPEPRKITPPTASTAPSDAIVLFDGSNFDEWSGTPAWTINNDGSMTVKPKSGGITTKRSFGDVQLHLEFRTPEVVKGEGQLRGNSGVFLQQKYEVQVLDNYDNRTYSNGQAGSIYKQYPPLVNACKGPGEWQTYDIIFKAPVFNADGIKVANGSLTVLQNGVLVQNNSQLFGTTEYIGFPKNDAHGKLPIMLQDHGDLVSYRNIWVREL